MLPLLLPLLDDRFDVRPELADEDEPERGVALPPSPVERDPPRVEGRLSKKSLLPSLLPMLRSRDEGEGVTGAREVPVLRVLSRMLDGFAERSSPLAAPGVSPRKAPGLMRLTGEIVPERLPAPRNPLVEPSIASRFPIEEEERLPELGVAPSPEPEGANRGTA